MFAKLTVCKKTVFEPVSFMVLEAWGLKVLEYQSSPNIDISRKHRNNYGNLWFFPVRNILHSCWIFHIYVGLLYVQK